MKRTEQARRRTGGYVSYVMVLSTGLVILTLMLGTYRSAMNSQQTQRDVTLRVDYAEKEDAVLRAIVNLTPNRAIRAMRAGSDSAEVRDELRWRRIFSDALNQVNARESTDAAVLQQLGLDGTRRTTSGDAEYDDILAVFDPIEPDPHDWDVSPATGRELGPGFPISLDASSSAAEARDRLYPIISRDKEYGSRAEGEVGLPVADYPQFNRISYPDIRFGYARPGEPFIAKRNWWAFSLDLADADDHVTGMELAERDFVLSIYEIPSQLAISAEAFAVLGEYADGSAWQNTEIKGGVYATRARVGENFSLERITGRRGLEFGASSSVGGDAITGDPFAPGERESYELERHAQVGAERFMPVSLASEGGRAAFVPINRGMDFFDRYAHDEETNTVSPTTWNEYSVGAMQCAMRLDITEVAGESDPTPTELEFSYIKDGERISRPMEIDPTQPPGRDVLPNGYVYEVREYNDQVTDADVVDFGNVPHDVAYGSDDAGGGYFFKYGVTGRVEFSNDTFGDPNVGYRKAGYSRPSVPFAFTWLHESKPCLEIRPERFPEFLELIGADGPEVNHSMAVNVDHPGNSHIHKPSIPSTDFDYGVIVKEAADLTEFTRGFSLVTNLRVYLADDFNVVQGTPPAGWDEAADGPYYPPASLFAPEKRYGGEIEPLGLQVSGQLGSLAGKDGEDGESVHLLEMRTARDNDVARDQVQVNLSQIAHPAALPPVTMMNWLIVLEERRAEFHEGTEAPN